MVKSFIYLFLFLVSLFGCRSSRVTTQAIRFNPTSYTFTVNIDSAKYLFKNFYYRYHNTLSFDLHDIHFQGDGYESIWNENAKSILNIDSNRNDVWMQLSVDSSIVYQGRNGKALPYHMECVAHFTPVGNGKVNMEIKVGSAWLITGRQLLPIPPHFVQNDIVKMAKPTGIEEYKILLCFGKGLNVFEQMPLLQTP